MELTVKKNGALRGETALPGDKSLAHRTALFAACAAGESEILNFPLSGVTRVMLQALSALGVEWQHGDNVLKLLGGGFGAWHPSDQALYCGNSATTMRLMAGALAASGLPALLDGSAGLRKRPMTRVVAPLQRLGVPITTGDGGCAPLTLARRAPTQRLRGGEISLPVASAQVKSALLLAALAADGPLLFREPGPSRDHSERLLRSMGVTIEIAAPNCLLLHPPSAPLQPLKMSLPGDISSAAFLIVAALIVPQSDIVLRAVGLNPTRTGLLDVLEQMGAQIERFNLREGGGEPLGDLRVRASHLRGVTVEGDLVVRMIDEFPVFTVAAACAEGGTEVREAGELRHKESDRISVLCREMTKLGVAIAERTDGFAIEGGKIAGGNAEACGDHRLAMSLALTGLVAEAPVTVAGGEILNESYPEFLTTLQNFGAKIHF